MTRIEVLESTLTAPQRGKFEQLLQRKFVQSQAVSMRIADLAHLIRDYYQQKGQKLLTPDAIHLATGIVLGVDCFYTFDGSRGKQKESREAKGEGRELGV